MGRIPNKISFQIAAGQINFLNIKLYLLKQPCINNFLIIPTLIKYICKTYNDCSCLPYRQYRYDKNLD